MLIEVILFFLYFGIYIYIGGKDKGLMIDQEETEGIGNDMFFFMNVFGNEEFVLMFIMHA